MASSSSSGGTPPLMFAHRVVAENGTQCHSVFKLVQEIMSKRAYRYKGDLTCVFPKLKRDTFSSICEPVVIPNQLLPASHLWMVFKNQYEVRNPEPIYTFKLDEVELPEVSVDVKINLDMIMLAFYIELTSKLSPDYSALASPLQIAVLETIDYGAIFGVTTRHTLDADIVSAILLSKHFVTVDPSHHLICVSTSHRIWAALHERKIPTPSSPHHLCKLNDEVYFMFSLQEFLQDYFAPLFSHLQEDLAISRDKIL